MKLTDYINSADIGGADAPHTVVEKLQAAIDRSARKTDFDNEPDDPRKLRELDKRCSCGDNQARQRHFCPYSYEMGGADTCECCLDCMYQCRMDI